MRCKTGFLFIIYLFTERERIKGQDKLVQKET